jgi:hypothetical protein
MAIVSSGRERYRAEYESADVGKIVVFSDAESLREAQEEMLADALTQSSGNLTLTTFWIDGHQVMPKA